MSPGNAKALVNRRQGRCWRFGDAVFDEGSWTLVIAGQRALLEAKPMHLLHELLLQAGDVVTKDELLDKVWPGLSVVEASLPTAIRKLRRALGSGTNGALVIETFPGVGYRLAIPVSVEVSVPMPARHFGSPVHAPEQVATRRRIAVPAWAVVSLALVLVLLAIGGYVASPEASSAQTLVTPAPVARAEAIQALRSLDADKLRALLARGWDPNAPLDTDRNTPINLALEICEWQPTHDRENLMLVVRMLVDAGERLDVYNVHGDTPYSIAKATRYCGPDHPATRLLHALCYPGVNNTLGDRCLATYERATPRGAV